ncbi:hypothetical protein ABZ234_07945 [Nocardiopsis sp. NPDC006198]|uniref:hypothetical protein n=1 Tax=Nocardiopsis sp. NPDC006198 TaxID=3154472 RepID=UPI0033BB0BCD
MNVYGERIRAAWTRLKPDEVAEMLDPEEFFRAKGEQVEEEIVNRAQELADREPQEPDYLREVKRLQTWRTEAESIVMRERLDEWLPPELEQPGL